MNIVCALLLLYMPEENVFWMMVSICEDIVPEYYNEELFGSLVDQQIFEVLVAKLSCVLVLFCLCISRVLLIIIIQRSLKKGICHVARRTWTPSTFLSL